MTLDYTPVGKMFRVGAPLLLRANVDIIPLRRIAVDRQGRPARHLYRLSATGVQLVAELQREAALADRGTVTSPPQAVLGSDAG